MYLFVICLYIGKYMLRREKSDVELSIPRKTETIIEVELTLQQKRWYRAVFEKNRSFLTTTLTNIKKVPSLINILMELRKVCNHPFLVMGCRERVYEEHASTLETITGGKESDISSSTNGVDGLKSFPPSTIGKNIEKSNTIYGETGVGVDLTEKVKEKTASAGETPLKEEDLSLRDPLIYSCGKVVFLHKILQKLKMEKSKTLIFSQFTSTLDMIQEYLDKYGYTAERIDGNVTGYNRMAAINRFNAENSLATIFLLTTKAGGVGLNLQAANSVIIYDSDWNPQGDLQVGVICLYEISW